MKSFMSFLMVSLLALALPPGCSKDSEAANPVAKQDAPAKKQATAAVAKIGFLDQQQCCKCTRDRTEKSWAALQVALGKKSIPVERIHIDSQEALAAPYRKLRPYQVIPAIYFLDDTGKLLEMLQGEVDDKAFGKLLM